MAGSVGLLALLSSISTIDGSVKEFTTADILQYRSNAVDERVTNKKFILPNKLMQTKNRLARLLEKRRSLEVDVGIISSTVSSTNNTSSSVEVPDRTQTPEVDATAISSETSSYSVSMGSINQAELIDQCLDSCPESDLCKCLGDEPPFGCYTGGYSEAFCTDSKACLPDNEASLFSAYLCPQNRCIANIDGIEKMREYYGVEEDIIMNMSTAVYEQMMEANILMRVCNYCVGRKSLCGTCKEDENFCNTVWQTSVYCKGDNCTLAQMKTVSDVCLPEREPTSYFYGQFINCEDYPELRVENYITDDENDNENANEEDDNVPTTSSSSKVVLGSAVALTTVLSIGSSL